MVRRRGFRLLRILGSVLVAALSVVLDKADTTRIEVNLGAAIRTGVVLVVTWVMVAVTGRSVPRGEIDFILASGTANRASWLCYYRAFRYVLASVVVYPLKN